MMNRRTCLAFCGASAMLTLAACATLPAADTGAGLPVGADKSYFAMGTEPGWTAEITPTQINYAGNYGETQIRVPVSKATQRPGGVQYSGSANGQTIEVDILYAQCNDGMSDRRYQHSVSLTANGTTYKGCGGAILPPVTLNGTQWRITQIDGTTLTAEQSAKASVRFDKDRIAVTVGCNQMSGGYKAGNHSLTVSAMISTMMACLAPIDQYERNVSTFFAEPVHLRYTDKGGMELLGKGSRKLVLQQAI